MLRERPILFSGAMVRAILDGRKTQTRRIVKPQPDKRIVQPVVGQYFQKPCPYGQPGDVLWVRETWTQHEYDGQFFYRADADHDGTIPYEVSNAGGFGGGVGNATIARWKPSIHMPRKAARISLRVTSVRVERVQSISEVDAIAEGIESGCIRTHPPLHVETRYIAPGVRMVCADGDISDHAPAFVTAKQAYGTLWNNINGVGAWERNDWVWVIGFERISS